MIDAAPRHLLILGSTGSIGRQALEVLPEVPGLRLVGLAAGRDAAAIVEQARAHGVRAVCLHDAGAAAQAAAEAPELAVHAGEAGIRELITGAAGRAAAEGEQHAIRAAVLPHGFQAKALNRFFQAHAGDDALQRGDDGF